MKGFLIFVICSFSAFAQISLLPEGSKRERAIFDPIPAEALFFDRLGAPYGASFESWIGSKNFAKEMQSGAGGYKIWSEHGEFLPKGEVFYRWPVETLPEKGYLEIFSDEHVIIEILNEGRHLAVGKGQLVFNLANLPAFYEDLILRFSSPEPHRALVWAQHFNEYEWVQAIGEEQDKWLSVDSLSQMKLRKEPGFRYKRYYQCDDVSQSYLLHFPQEVENVWLNGVKIAYPQAINQGVLKKGKNELLFESKNWRMGADHALIAFEQKVISKDDDLQWYDKNNNLWSYESSYYLGDFSDSGQKLIFRGEALDSTVLKAEIVCTKESLKEGLNLLFRKEQTLPGSYWRTEAFLVPPFVMVNGVCELLGRDGLVLKNLKEGKNTIEMQVSGKMLKPYLSFGKHQSFDLRAPQHAYQFSLHDKQLKIDLASKGEKACELYVNNKKLHDAVLGSGLVSEVFVPLEGLKEVSMGAPELKEFVIKLQDEKVLAEHIDLSDTAGIKKVLSYFLACEEDEAYEKFNQLRHSEGPIDLLTLMPDGKAIGLYLYPHFRDQIINASLESSELRWTWLENVEHTQPRDRFEMRAFNEWLEAMDKQSGEEGATQDLKREFYKARFSTLNEIYSSLKAEFMELQK